MRFGTQDEDTYYWFNFKNRKLYTDPQYKHILHLELEVRLRSAAIFTVPQFAPPFAGLLTSRSYHCAKTSNRNVRRKLKSSRKTTPGRKRRKSTGCV